MKQPQVENETVFTRYGMFMGAIAYLVVIVILLSVLK